MKRILPFTMGYVGYFLIVYMALRAFLTLNDMVGFVLLLAGSILLGIYVQFLEQKQATPKYGWLIKLIIMLLFVISIVFMFFNSIF